MQQSNPNRDQYSLELPLGASHLEQVPLSRPPNEAHSLKLFSKVVLSPWPCSETMTYTVNLCLIWVVDHLQAKLLSLVVSALELSLRETQTVNGHLQSLLDNQRLNNRVM